jgi:hypothetical protein
MSGDAHVRFWERLGVQLPGPTHPSTEVRFVTLSASVGEIIVVQHTVLDDWAYRGIVFPLCVLE